MGSRAVAWAVAALGIGGASPEDALQAFRRAVEGVEAREAAWWKELPDAEVKAHREFHRPMREQYADKVTEPFGDFAPIRALYEEALAFETARGAAFASLASSNHPGSPAALWKAALAAADLQAEAERDNRPGTLKQEGFLLRQGPSIRLHCLESRRTALAKAFAAASGSLALLGGRDAWEEARTRDLAARSAVRRVLVADFLAALPGGTGRARLGALLADEVPEVRIAALEGLGAGPGGLPPAAAALLGDHEPPVRFALLDAVRAHPPDDATWLEPLARCFLEGRGRLRGDALRALRAASGHEAGDDPTAWRAWLEQTRSAREAGTFHRPAAAPADAPSPGTPAGAGFWGIPVESDRVLLAADGCSTLVVPADHSFQVTRHVTDWVTGQRGWRKERESVQDVVVRLLPPFMEKLPPESTLRILLLGSPGNKYGEVTWFEERGPVAVTAPQRRRARDFVADYRIGTTDFFAEGLQTILGADGPDTAVLVTGGSLRTDRFLLPEALAAEFRRRNRFRRLRLHVVHVMDRGPEVARLLREIAEGSGGTLVRALAPPPR